ncbi:hypothetical protein SDC9_86439 [bioreactor metagenome]|uniref:Uncharacterized protein n=1 Tax=bioreactor metagenome TaxID=1076179 RepID=A0A644ZM68_9ZZZZ
MAGLAQDARAAELGQVDRRQRAGAELGEPVAGIHHVGQPPLLVEDILLEQARQHHGRRARILQRRQRVDVAGQRPGRRDHRPGQRQAEVVGREDRVGAHGFLRSS